MKFHAKLSWAWKKFYNLGARKLVKVKQQAKPSLLYQDDCKTWRTQSTE